MGIKLNKKKLYHVNKIYLLFVSNEKWKKMIKIIKITIIILKYYNKT